MTAFMSRADWGARPRRGSAAFPAGRPLGVACHWPGTTSQFHGKPPASIAAALRSWQNYHMDNRGWSDIGYNVGISWDGRVWELRGTASRSAANGGVQSNADYAACLWILGVGEQPTEAQIQAFRAWRSSRLLAAHHQAAAVKTHNDVRQSPTDCPGPAVTALVRSGALLRPGGGPTPPKPQPKPKPEPKVYLSRLRYGVRDSDSVRHLQRRLNGVKLRGGRDLPVTGNFLDLTLAEVRKWQTQIPHDPPDGKLGPKQARLLFGSGYAIVNDL